MPTRTTSPAAVAVADSEPRGHSSAILFALAGTMTLLSALLAATVSPWFLLLTAFVGVNQWLYVTFGDCPASLLFLAGSRSVPRCGALHGAADPRGLRRAGTRTMRASASAHSSPVWPPRAAKRAPPLHPWRSQQHRRNRHPGEGRRRNSSATCAGAGVAVVTLLDLPMARSMCSMHGSRHTYRRVAHFGPCRASIACWVDGRSSCNPRRSRGHRRGGADRRSAGASGRRAGIDPISASKLEEQYGPCFETIDDGPGVF